MNIQFYNISDDKRVVDKHANSGTAIGDAVGIEVISKLSIINPVVEIANNSSFWAANYAYISDLGRYYYVDDISLNTAQRMIVSMTVDVLKTYAAQIRGCTATVLRSSSTHGGRPTEYTDSKLPVFPSNQIITSIELPEVNNELDTNGNWSYLLTVVGDGQ